MRAACRHEPILGVARATGEFGATLMVAGSLPGQTRTLPVALYESILLDEQATAFGIMLLLTGVSLMALFGLRALERNRGDKSADAGS